MTNLLTVETVLDTIDQLMAENRTDNSGGRRACPGRVA